MMRRREDEMGGANQIIYGMCCLSSMKQYIHEDFLLDISYSYNSAIYVIYHIHIAQLITYTCKILVNLPGDL